MGHGLGKAPFLQDENILVGNEVHKGIVGDVQPDVLLQVIFVNTDDAVLLKIAVLIGITKWVAAVSAFGGAVVGVGVQVDAINLGEGYQSCLVQAFGSPLDQGIGVVVAAADD